jgi:hypothetical protein
MNPMTPRHRVTELRLAKGRWWRLGNIPRMRHATPNIEDPVPNAMWELTSKEESKQNEAARPRGIKTLDMTDEGVI